MKKTLLLAAALVLGMSAQAQNLHGNLEQWRTVFVPSPNPITTEAPVGWYSTDSIIFMANTVFPNANFKEQVLKTTSAHGGNYAVQITTVTQDSMGLLPGLFTNAQPIVNFSTFDPNDPVNSIEFVGGTPLTQRIYSLNAWVKYLPKGNDEASISVYAMLEGQGAGGSDSAVGNGTLLISQAYTSYTYVSLPLNYANSTVVPNKMVIYISSSGNNPVDSSTLFVDDIQASTMGIAQSEAKGQFVSIYPNPSNGIIHLHTTLKEKLQLKVYTITGALMAEKSFVNDHVLDISKNTPGIYFYSVLDTNGVVIQHGKLMTNN